MKKFASLIFCLSLFSSSSLFGEESITLEGVHLCCKACVRAVDGAVAKIEGASAVTDKDEGTVVLNGPDKKTLRKGVNAIIKAGFYGTSAESAIKVKDRSGAKDQTVTSLTITNLHLCCGGCVEAVDGALATVDGVSGNTAEKKVSSFEVVGEFNDKDVFAALHKAGFAGRVKE